jgi:hypothetical protein
LLVNLISFLHSDSPFSWKKNFSEAITPRGVRVATFYGLPGNFWRFGGGHFARWVGRSGRSNRTAQADDEVP